MNYIIWDLDGTLIDSYPFIVKAFYDITEEYELHYSQEYIFNYLKKYTTKLLVEQIAKESNVTIDYISKEFRSNFFRMESQIKLIDNAKEVLEDFKNKGFINFIYTHKGITTHDVLENNQISDYFEEIVTSENNFKWKPNPEAVNYLIEKYNLDKSVCYLIGDRYLDVDCAKNAGIKSVFYNPLGLVYEEAEFNITDLIELKQIII